MGWFKTIRVAGFAAAFGALAISATTASAQTVDEIVKRGKVRVGVLIGAPPFGSVDSQGNAIEVATEGRHDPCVGIRATPIAEAMLALVLMDHALRHRAQCGDVVCQTPRIPGKIA